MGKIFDYLINQVKYYLYKLVQPYMICPFLRSDGTVLKNTRISNTTYFGSKERLYVEDHVYIAHYTVIDASHHVTIKEGCQIGFFVSIFTHSSHMSIRLYGKEYSRHFPNLKGYEIGPVYIGDYSFIGPHSIIMPNTRIGKGSIVTAYSYVQGDFPDFVIISGNPAKVISDTRRLDEVFLRCNPELREFYKSWANRE